MNGHWRWGRAFCLLALVVGFYVTSGEEVRALNRGSLKASDDAYFNWIHIGLSSFKANFFANIIDPVSVDATQFTITLDYDETKYAFRPSTSGPLGAFSVGGDAPATTPGIGTMPVKELPATGYNAGTALPGSTLTYTDLGGVLTMTYQLASPVTISGPVNFFRIDFDFLNQILFDPSQSTVTYHAATPGTSLTQTNFSCLTTDASNTCGSESPATGVSINLVEVPEPAAGLLLVIGLNAAACVRRRG